MQVSVAGFEIEAEIGRGGFGVVYRARQLDFGRLAAIKVLLPGDTPAELQRRFAQECRAIGALRPHPNIVTVYSTGSTDDGMPYLAMRYLGGGSLARRVPMAAGAVAALGARLADGLGVAHAGGVIHRDVKPANILFDDDAEPVLVDFGISALTGDGNTTSSDVALSVAYAPPEVLHGDRATTAADVYALGATLFAGVTGRTPFADPDGATPIARLATRILNDPVEDLRPAGVPDALCAVIERCMAKDPSQRFAAMADVRTALLPIEGDAVLASPAQLWGMPTTSVRATPVAGVATGVATGVGTGGGTGVGGLDVDATSRRGAPAPARQRGRQRLVLAAAAVTLLTGGLVAAVAAGSGSDRAPDNREVAGTISGSGDLSLPPTTARTGTTGTTGAGAAAGSARPTSADRAGVVVLPASTAPDGHRVPAVTVPAGPPTRRAPGATATRTAPGRTATATRTITRPAPNRAPVIGTVPSFSGNEGLSVRARLSATDPEGGSVRFGITGLPRGLAVSSAGLITGQVSATASSVTAGYHTIRSQRFTLTVTATDTAGKSAVVRKVWTVHDTRFVMPNYRGYRGCNGNGSCHEPVRNFRDLGPRTIKCKVSSTYVGRVVLQSVRAGATSVYGRTFLFYVGARSC